MTAGGLKVAASDGRLEIVQEGKKKKFVNKVEQISFNALLAKQAGHSVIYITERAVFELTDEGLVLTEIAPGIDLETQILSQIDFNVKIAADLKEMDPRIFTDEPMGLSERGLSK
jgi:propionate CoA-transferase